jgi:hypothetical protein
VLDGASRAGVERERETQMERYNRRQSFWKVGLGAGVLVALAPALAIAQQTQTPYATAVLYEVDETINCNPGGSPDPMVDPFCVEETAHGFGTRIADAVLEGTVEGPPEFSGPISVEATSILSQVDWTGPAHGRIRVETAAGTVQANMAGQLDLSLAQTGSAPLAPISGKWHGTKGFNVGGTFSGVFEIPFPCGEVSPTGICYLENGKLIPAETPLVKLVVTFHSK